MQIKLQITQEVILYSSSDLCVIGEGPHPLINMETIYHITGLCY